MKHSRPLALILSLSTLAAMTVSYQNCAELRPSTAAVQMQSTYETMLRDDSIVRPKLLESEDLLVWRNVATTALLTAPLTLEPAGQGLQTPVGLNFAGDAYSVVAVVDSTEDRNVLTIASTTAGEDESRIEIRSGVLKAIKQTDASSAIEFTFSLSSVTAPFVVGATFGKKADLVHVQVNGRSLTNKVSRGTPLEQPVRTRRILIGNTGTSVGPSSARMPIALYESEMAEGELNSLVRLMASESKIKDVGYIPYVDPKATPPPVDPALPIRNLVQSRCSNCHGDWASSPASAWIAAGRVVPGNALASPLYLWLTNSEGPVPKRADGSNGSKDMPRDGSGALSPADLLMIKNWINSL